MNKKGIVPKIPMQYNNLIRPAHIFADSLQKVKGTIPLDSENQRKRGGGIGGNNEDQEKKRFINNCEKEELL